MIECSSCGQQNPEGFRFCGNCASPLLAAPAAREQRKTVTVLFCDVSGSTTLGETQDPEAIRALLARFFGRMKAVVEAHGGTVEKFIGDAVMAVFGVPQVHEDDALRAVRAALEMRDALPALGIQARIGINTGEVVTGTAERLATGDAVNVAARLQQAAAPQEIYIGRDTYALVESLVDATQIEPLSLKGKSLPVHAYRLDGLTASPSRRNEVTMVGRVTELRRLRDAYDQSVRDRTCQLFTILGNAGVGKSRLVHEFLDGLDATVVRGGCLSYGDGITYWPVVDVIKQLTAATPTLELDTELASLLSQESFAAPSHQIAWSFRKLLEDTAQERPLVVVFDDLQWAEPTFLDLIEHVADLSRDAPILLLCMARPDLLDKRQTWAGGKLNATNLLLEPLSGMETAEMVSQLVGEMSDDIGRRVVEAAEGNPLFVEEMVALVRDSGDENVRVPPTIHALLAARLDQLDAHEREVLERGSVEGRLFHRGAVEALSPERADGEVSTRLTSLVRKDLLRPDKAELPGEDAFRFRHLLIRDAAYDALPKSVRADLHERFARWLEEFGADMAEIDEITGYHLEQACTYRLDLGREVDPNLAASARRKLVAAGRRAALRGDYGAAANLLRRADQLPGPPDVTVRMDLMSTMFFGEQGTAAAKLAQQHLAQALATSDKRTELCARIEIEYMSTFREPEGATDRLVAAADEAAKTFEATHDTAGMYVVHQARGQIANIHCDVAMAVTSFDAATAMARELGIDNDLVPQRANFRVLSAEPNSDTLRWFETEAAGHHADVDRCRAAMFAMMGRFDEARALLGDELRLAEGSEVSHLIGSLLSFEGVRIESLAGDYRAAVAFGERGCRYLEEVESWGVLSTGAGILARAQFYAGRLDKAEAWAERSRELGIVEDGYTQMLWRQARALVLAQRGDGADAEQLLHEALALGRKTNSPVLLGEVYFDLGNAMATLGERAKARAAYADAIALFDAKENIAMAEQTRARLASVSA